MAVSACIAGSLLLASGGVFADEASITAGKEVAFDRRKGNCLACHMIEGGESPGNIGPPLVAMKARFPDRERLRAQIWDPQVVNPNTRMPPFGKHKILSEADIDNIVDFLLTL
jgi:sulfur-oxidizing protein SoxX